MRAVIQRVSEASVTVEGEIISEIGLGLLILLGIEEEDTNDDVQWLSGKISRLRIFGDENGMMNKSIIDIDGEVIVVSQFTLYASTKKGNRPSFIRAAKPENAIPLYEGFVQRLSLELDKKIGTGIFGADMKVALENDGPVTITIDTKNKEDEEFAKVIKDLKLYSTKVDSTLDRLTNADSNWFVGTFMKMIR